MSETEFEGFYGGDDSLYEEAKRVVIEARKASASLLQRRLRIGYARAARLIDMLEEKGIVGPGEGAKPREVFVKTEEEDEGWQKV
jgi:S-DNA-T family DNA segregation ATPase FtsK/SpoIIIE